MTISKITRRTILRGLGVSLAIPSLESFAVGGVSGIPLRMGFTYIPNGVIMDEWRPSETGPLKSLPNSLKPLQNHTTDFQVISGLNHTKAYANGDGGGDHARANATFLTGCQARKTAGSDIKVGVSVDQIAADAIGDNTKLRSLELSCDGVRRSGKCDSGYSCAYQYNLSWKTESMPMVPESNPRLVFERLFGNTSSPTDRKGQLKRRVLNKSILDFALQGASNFNKRLSKLDQEKLSEYFTSVRELEKRIEREEKNWGKLPDLKSPVGIPENYREHLRLMFDMMVLAFQSDSTRISSFLLAHDGSNRSFREIGVPEGHHSLSHHKNDPEKIKKLAKIDHFYSEQFAYFINKLSTTQEIDGSRLLDHCMIVFGGGISDGNRHRHSDLPVLLAGGSSHGLTAGRHVDFQGVPMTNLYLGMLDRAGVQASQVGDSSGRIKDL
ncbi:MAG: DUF1552 domain-containing protein [Verrucomicrobiota bacterium]|nr:DUF1552 domain-containing protein [Verrucomicrobiota bacterium]